MIILLFFVLLICITIYLFSEYGPHLILDHYIRNMDTYNLALCRVSPNDIKERPHEFDSLDEKRKIESERVNE